MFRAFNATLGVLGALVFVFVIIPGLFLGGILYCALYHIEPLEVLGFDISGIPDDARFSEKTPDVPAGELSADNEPADVPYDAPARHHYWSSLRRQHWEDEAIRDSPKRWKHLDPFQQRELEEREENWSGKLREEFNAELKAHPELEPLLKKDVDEEVARNRPKEA